MSSSFYFCLLLMSLFHSCLATKYSNDVLCKDVEREALLQFKHGLIDRANLLASWDEVDKECCSWAGIVCDNFTGHVQQIHLRGFDGHCRVVDYTTPKEYNEVSERMLGGELNPSLLNLKQLNHLDLSCNDFSGIEVPNFMGSFEKLRYLNISSSRFGGTIPPQLGNLSELHVLCLGSFYDDTLRSELTSMSDMQWLSRLRLLHHLDMSGVDLSKEINWLQVMNTIPSLVELHLSSCQLSYIHPHIPSLNLTSLSLLDLSNNYFDNSSMPQWLFSIKSLLSLDLSWCNFDGPNLYNTDGFHNLTSLEILHAPVNDFMGSSLVLKGLSSLGSSLVLLDIRSCGVTSSVLDVLHNLTSLLSLDLSQNQLTRRVPKSLGDLCNLREIDMSSNNFQNVSLTFLIESFLECKSPSLESLFLESSRLSGHLPDSIGRLRFLKSLSLRENQISGTIPYSIGRLLSLEKLDLRENQLIGNPPDSLGLLSKLHFLGLSYNLLTGIMTETHFDKLSSLKDLWGSGNNIVLRPRIANWVPPFQLRTLILTYWDLGPQFPSWLLFQRDLERLEISHTKISSTIPELFWRSIPNLRILNVSENNIQGRLFDVPAQLSDIDLSSNNFSGQLPKLLERSLASKLDLSNNAFTGSLRHLLCLNGGENLESLSLANNHLFGVIPECWTKWKSLLFLNLENNNLSGVIPSTLGSLSSLGSLNMCNNKLSGKLPTSLTNLANLEILQLARNKLVGRIPSWFGKEFSSLRILNLRSNKFDKDIPHELCDLIAIQILVLAHNNLSGNIPRCFNKFRVLVGKETTPSGRIFSLSVLGTELLGSASLVIKGREDEYNTILRLVMILDLSSNNLFGGIPSELTSFQALQSLNLSRNQLTGRIPKKIGDMKSLESFDISSNHLSGELPTSLSYLSFLSNFNVSYNNLTGRIPLSTQLSGFDESSFFGNKLCGDPLSNNRRVEVPGSDKRQEIDGPHGPDWGLVISIVCGFVVGFWVLLTPLIVSTAWRIAYFHFLLNLWYMFCDAICK